MNILTIIFVFTSTLVISSCKSPDLAVSGNAKENRSDLKATKKQHFRFNQVIRFGDYYSSKVKRSWPKHSSEFALKFQKAEQKLSFTQYTPFGKTAAVMAINHLSNREIKIFKDLFSYSLLHQNTFIGTVIPTNDESKNWNFVIHDPESGSPNDLKCGMIKDNSDNIIMINRVKKLKGQSNWVLLDNFGFEFIMNGWTVCAVSTINNGRIWLKDDIEEDLKLVLASISTALLVRQSLY
ncbi:MAG: hypothetical protein IPM86_08845 [Saprospiraceae bacterium]|nr:hypothetical protein [Saprospiraceae bacterium]